MSGSRLEAVIGLEIHVQLRTATKLFCGDAAEFGAEPNTRVCPVCLGLPGALPVLNARAVELAVRAALGLGCAVHPRSAFARKHYFYPDLPKGYQITQHDRPLAGGGHLDLPAGDGEDAARVRIRRVQLEEDSGKSLHDRVPGASAVDLNRAGVPLIEIVTEPDLRSPARARAFLIRLRRALRYLEVSDCSMEEGSLRVDANVSVRPPGEPLGARCELKNLSSFGQLERALDFEIARQRGVREGGGEVRPLTLLWDAAAGEARPLRAKEEAPDYRWLDEPDLPPLALDPARVAALAADLPEMPWVRMERFVAGYRLAPAHAEALTDTPELADYYEAVARHGAPPREAAGWVLGEVLAARNASPAAGFPVAPAALAELVVMVGAGALSRAQARGVLARMAESGEEAAAVAAREGVAQVSGAGEVGRWVDEVLAAHPAEAARYRAGELRLAAFFVGRVMRLSGGRADPAVVNELLRERLAGTL